MDSIRGVFPGGPRRRRSDEGPSRRPATLAELSVQADRRRLARRERRRARRRRTGIVLALVGSAAVGFALGHQSHASPDSLRAELESANALDGAVSREVNRVLLELWKMEDVEAKRGLRSFR